MARRGSFGRSPRPAASLTNTIIAIAREMQQREDQNIVDAWQKGGLYEGHKVTDSMILKHWKDRAGDVAKNDPMYDMYHNAYMEYDYSIHESIMRTAFAQGKVSNGAAASFYLNWSKKVPKNSEFWRVLQRDAAQFTQASKAKSDAEARRRAELRYQNGQQALNDKYVAPGQFILDTFREMARHGLRPDGGNSPVDPMTGELYQFTSSDVQDMLQMVDRMTDAHFKETPNGKGLTPTFTQDGTKATTRVLYHDNFGRPVTGNDIYTKLRGMGFKGQLTLDNFNTFINEQKHGLQKQINLAQSTGHLTDATRFGKALNVTSEIGREVQAWPVEQSYLTAREQRNQVLNNPASSAQDITDAKEQYEKQLSKFLADPRVKNNDIFVNKVKGELAGDATTTTLAEDFTGLNAVEPRDVAAAQLAYQRAEDGLKSVEAGTAVWTTGEWDKGTNVFHPSAGGSTVGPATPYAIQQNSGGVAPVTTYMPDQNGRYLPVQVMGQDITTHAVGPDGKELPIGKGMNPVVGHLFVYPDGKQVVGYSDGKGGQLYSDIQHSPWGNSAMLSDNGHGFTLTVQAPTTEDGLANSGFKVEVGSNNQKTLTYDPFAAMLGTDPAHKNTILNSGGDPSTDFRSPNYAYYAGAPEGQHNLAQLAQDEAFKATVEAQTYAATGFTPQMDDKGNVVWVGGNSGQFERGMAQGSATSGGGFPDESLHHLDDRSTSASSLIPDQRYEGQNPYATGTGMAGLYDQGYRPATAMPLATATLGQSNPAISSPFASGTLNITPTSGVDTSSLGGIRLASAGIKVPSVPAMNFGGPALPTSPANIGTPTTTIGGGTASPTAPMNSVESLANYHPYNPSHGK